MRMEMDLGEKPKKGCSRHCCSLNRCSCIFLIIFIVGLIAAVAALAVLYAQNVKDDDDVHVPSTTAPPASSQPWENHRLPTYILPDHYDLTLFPDFYDGNDRFSGDVMIRLNVTMDTRYLLIHIRDLTVTRTRLLRAGVEMQVKRTFHHEANEYWVVEAYDTIGAGSQVSVELKFEGSLVNGIVGLYKSVYVDTRNNATKYLATSKFQPTDARKAFPCLDEPGLKSTFTTTLIHRQDFQALSNMPIEETTTRTDGLIATHFQKSVPMVTYLKCFIVCEFSYKENTTKSGTPFRVYATPDKIDQVDYSLDIGVRILEHFEDYYGLGYPLPKMDMIAIPDFVSGAMEHWGLITYRETNLLYDEMEASLANKQRVAVVVSHELAHMWFGNLVTMNWWDDLWLNEGFASFVEYIGVNHVHPDWDMMDVFVPSDLQSVMPDDSIISSHPIVVPVDHPSEITQVFDSISYSKGASVIRMLESFMGEQKFREGLQAYMQKYQYKTTVTDDLWLELQNVEGAPMVKTIMDTWTRQMGYPVVTVQIQGSSLKLTQERFLLDPSADKTQPPSPYHYQWRIPIRYQTTTEAESTLVWMNGKELILEPSINSAEDWIKLNLRQEGFFRVNYPTAMWERLASLLANNHEVLGPSDRSGLIDDIFNLASADLADYGLALNIIQYMGNEEHLIPWDTVSDRLSYIDDMMVTTIHYEAWRTFVAGLAGPVLEKIGYEDTGTHLQRQLRSIIITLACGHGDGSCQGNMTAMFRGRLRGEHISPNIRSAVYRFGMESIGREDEWDYMWNEYTMAVVPQEKRRLLYAVTQTQEPWLVQRLLTYSMDQSKIRDQDFFTMITYLSWNRVALTFVWDFVRENWLPLVDRFNLGNRYLGRMIPGLVENYNSQSQLKQVTDFFAQYPEAGAGSRAREQAVEQINANIAWVEANLQSIVTWLDANVP